jgi:exosortase/archaeosortase family protein
MFARHHLSHVLWLAPLAWLWFILINDLRGEWTVNPQYSYGWAVPFLCAFLVWQNIQKSEARSQKPEIHHPLAILYLLFALCALLYAPTRLIEEANPGWRLVSWALAIEVVGITLCFVGIAQSAKGEASENPPRSPTFALGSLPLAQFVFPICFFLVAVPWPSQMEQLVIQGLTRLDTACTTELLGWLGIPAMPHGNVIEVATGVVGIDEACSGIRSFQATLMISLFLGEFYSLGALRRALCVFAGFALSFLFNLARMSLLMWVAARKGVAAIASWHDPAGVTILVACFFSLWGLGRWMGRIKQKTENGNQKSETLKVESGKQKAETGITHPSPFTRHLSLAVALGTWIIISEVSIEAWYRSHEARVPVAAHWTVAWPTDNPTFKELPIAGVTRQILRYDEGRSAAWQETNLTWQAVFLRWKPGRTAMHLAQNHTPEVCFTAAGHTLDTISPQKWFDVNGLRMPFLAYQVTDAQQPFFVFYCLWDDRASAQGFDTMMLTYAERLAPVMAGLRNPGQRSLEIAVTGPDNAAEAEAAVRKELQNLITTK